MANALGRVNPLEHLGILRQSPCICLHVNNVSLHRAECKDQKAEPQGFKVENAGGVLGHRSPFLPAKLHA